MFSGKQNLAQVGRPTPASEAEQPMNGWQSFVSLVWYDGLIEFLFRFVAKTSEPLLAVGLIFSAADILTKGRLMQNNLLLSDAWAWTQAIAIESSGGVVLVYALSSFRQRDTPKGWLYLLLSALLAIVGGIMLFTQLVASATGATDSIADGAAWFVYTMAALRAVVSIGYVVMCRTKHIRFTDLFVEPPAPVPAPALQPPVVPTSDLEKLLERLDARYEQRFEAVIQQVRITLEQTALAQMWPEQQALPPPQEVQGSRDPSLEAGTDEGAVPASSQRGGTGSTRSAEDRPAQEARLEETYRELAEGGKVSASALARKAHVRKETALSFLAQQKEVNA